MTDRERNRVAVFGTVLGAVLMIVGGYLAGGTIGLGLVAVALGAASIAKGQLAP